MNARPPHVAPCIGVLAVQGSFALHRIALERIGALVRLVRRPSELASLDGLVIPGGESTVMAQLTEESGLFDELRRLGKSGLPMFGTCAGAILLGWGREAPRRLELAPVAVHRNAYGRQKESFETEIRLANDSRPFLGIFIRAPRLEPTRPGSGAETEVLGWVGPDPVLARCGSVLLATFHPELTDDARIHEYFLAMVRDARRPWAGEHDARYSGLAAGR